MFIKFSFMPSVNIYIYIGIYTYIVLLPQKAGWAASCSLDFRELVLMLEFCCVLRCDRTSLLFLWVASLPAAATELQLYLVLIKIH